MNKIVVSGNLTKDPERINWGKGKYKQEGVAFTIADNNGEDKNGEDIVMFWDCVLTGKRADFIEDNFKKGSHITVVGRAGYRVNETETDFYVNPRIDFITDILI